MLQGPNAGLRSWASAEHARGSNQKKKKRPVCYEDAVWRQKRFGPPTNSPKDGRRPQSIPHGMQKVSYPRIYNHLSCTPLPTKKRRADRCLSQSRQSNCYCYSEFRHSRGSPVKRTVQEALVHIEVEAGVLRFCECVRTSSVLGKEGVVLCTQIKNTKDGRPCFGKDSSTLDEKGTTNQR